MLEDLSTEELFTMRNAQADGNYFYRALSVFLLKMKTGIKNSKSKFPHMALNTSINEAINVKFHQMY